MQDIGTFMEQQIYGMYLAAVKYHFGARNGKLVTMVGGTEEGVASVRELMDIYSADVQRMGGPGAG